MVCASLWLPGIPETLSFPEEQPSLGSGRQGRVINKCKAHGGFDKKLLWKHKMTPSFIYLVKPRAILGIC